MRLEKFVGLLRRPSFREYAPDVGLKWVMVRLLLLREERRARQEWSRRSESKMARKGFDEMGAGANSLDTLGM